MSRKGASTVVTYLVVIFDKLQHFLQENKIKVFKPVLKHCPDISVQKGGRMELEFSKEKDKCLERVSQVYTLNFWVM